MRSIIKRKNDILKHTDDPHIWINRQELKNKQKTGMLKNLENTTNVENFCRKKETKKQWHEKCKTKILSEELIGWP